MPTFTGNVTDLAEQIAYERQALEFVRTELFGQTEASSQTLRLDLSNAKDADGYYPSECGMFPRYRLAPKTFMPRSRGYDLWPSRPLSRCMTSLPNGYFGPTAQQPGGFNKKSQITTGCRPQVRLRSLLL
ncbi:hypothetical protein FBZ94_104659 [Bradyrhizobium sacchari]|uniref:Uncharacterized protein n=1 Tax=Bradyrhizobium sacchari TaxID=1399419 RepID=A0A560JRZ8_9BRAD|nr:hypothetical protein FBZ94_104659 [Bradyrhizobium sacchari]TWB73756.1 hypothetical protein FBZ95_1056 [Bradyrhizobium sacchari]